MLRDAAFTENFSDIPVFWIPFFKGMTVVCVFPRNPTIIAVVLSVIPVIPPVIPAEAGIHKNNTIIKKLRLILKIFIIKFMIILIKINVK